ncbi:MAG: type II secretion system GspH family protein [Kiritimatiellales bacterium]|nr:type II secretion system GspH family protein [Kiritimatiellales bacterium]
MKNKNAFTLIELLIVIAVIGILMSIMMPAISGAKRSAMKAQAQTEMKSIETAIKSYFNEYGKLPAPSDFSQGGGDLPLDPDNSKKVIMVLTADEAEGGTANPREIMFLEPQGNNQQGEFNDPWGEQYRIALDTSYDGELNISEISVSGLRRRQAILSVGLFLQGGSSDTNDVLRSWQ